MDYFHKVEKQLLKYVKHFTFLLFFFDCNPAHCNFFQNTLALSSSLPPWMRGTSPRTLASCPSSRSPLGCSQAGSKRSGRRSTRAFKKPRVKNYSTNKIAQPKLFKNVSLHKLESRLLCTSDEKLPFQGLLCICVQIWAVRKMIKKAVLFIVSY